MMMRRAFFVVAMLCACSVPAARVTAQEGVLQRLNESPRHLEWVQLKRGERVIHCFAAFPEVEQKAAAVIVIHENKGLTNWVRSVCDQLAEAGYVAIAPDLLSGHGPNGGKTSDFESIDKATEALYALDPAEVTADLNAVADHVMALPACDGTVTVAGFCWGGGQTFRFATNRADLKAAFVFYGSFQWTKEDLARIKCPVQGFYAENDARINATLEATASTMKELGKTFEPVIYAGAGHGFMRAGEDPNASEPNRKARDEAWVRWKKTLASL